jgi:hypothetical protein
MVGSWNFPSAPVVTDANAGPTVGGFVVDEVTGYAVMTTPLMRGAVVRLSLPAPGSEGPSTVPRKKPGVGLTGGAGGGAPVLSFCADTVRPLSGDRVGPVELLSEHAARAHDRNTSDMDDPRNHLVLNTLPLSVDVITETAREPKHPYTAGPIVTHS